MNGTVDHVIKRSILYSYLLSQPFASYVDAYPVLQNKVLKEAEQLEHGDHGEVVRVLQKKLKILSYYDDEIDGDYDILTEYALKKFQADHQITITGQTDKETIIALIEVEKDLHLKRLKHLSSSVYPGMHGKDVEIVQDALKYFGYYDGQIDGIYGPLTKDALQIAEEEHGIELTKEVTQESLVTLYESSANDNKTDAETEQQAKVDESQAVEEKKQEQKSEITKVETKSSNSADIVQAARSLIGSPYVWGGDSPSGFDCSGFINYIFQEQDMTIPRTVSDIWNFSQHVESPSVGDLVFFETYKPGPSHMGVYIGDGKFIHAGLSNGVSIAELNESYWQQRYLGAKRIQ